MDKLKGGAKSKIPKKRAEQIERYIDEIDDDAKQFSRELNELPTSEDNRDNIMLQDIINKNEIAADNSIKLIETSLTEIGVEASTQTGTGGLTLRELQGLDRELRMISGSLRSAIAKAIATQVDIDKEKRKLEEMANDETYSDEQREEVRARLQRFQDEQKAINDQICILKGDKASNASDETVASIFSNKFCIPLDFEILESSLPLYQYGLGSHLTYELTFADYSDVIKASDHDASYMISNISLEFNTVTNASLASQIRTECMKSSTLYNRILRAHIIPVNDSSTSFSVDINSPSKGLKGVLLIFMKERSATKFN